MNSRYGWRILATVVGFAFFLFLAVGSGGSSGSSKGGSSKSSVSTGEDGILNNGSAEVIAAISESAYDEMIKAAAASDNIGIANMALAGLVVLIPSGTKVKVIDRTFGTRRVRILEGDYYGNAYWVAMEHVKK